MTQAPVIVWFRRDFRFSDHEALSAAHSTYSGTVHVLTFTSAHQYAYRQVRLPTWVSSEIYDLREFV